MIWRSKEKGLQFLSPSLSFMMKGWMKPNTSFVTGASVLPVFGLSRRAIFLAGVLRGTIESQQSMTHRPRFIRTPPVVIVFRCSGKAGP